MKTKLLYLAPTVVLGLFIGRLFSELWSRFNGSTSIEIALLITLSSTFLTIRFLKNIPLSKSWPALLLSFYAFYWEADWRIAFLILFFTSLVWLLLLWNSSDFFPIHRPSLLAAITFVAFFVLYYITLAPDILPADSGEFQVVAANLGVAHPPGFALYTMLAHFVTLLPLGPSAAFKVNLLSAVTSSFTLAVLYVGVYFLTEKHIASIIAVITLGSATTFWAQATTANIRSMSAMFTAVMLTIILVYHRATLTGPSHANPKRVDHLLILFAFFLSLGLTHHASLIFMGIVFVIFILLIDPNLVKSPRRWWRPFLAFLLGITPVIYLVLRANSGARGASPALASLPGFLEHILALGFRGDLFTFLEPSLFWERLKIMGNVITFQFELFLIFGMVIGLIIILKEDWRLALLFGGSFIVHTFITATYRAPQSVEYMLPAYVALTYILGFVAGKSDRLWQTLRWDKLKKILNPLLLSAFFVAAAWQLIHNFPSFLALHNETTARNYAQPLLENAPANSIILSDWHWVTPLWYLQEVENLRTDVTVRFVFPEGEPYAQTWARRITKELSQSRSVISTHYSPETFHVLPPPQPIGEAFLFRAEPHLQMPLNFKPLSGLIGQKIELVGFQISTETVPVADEVVITIAWRAVDDIDPETSLFVHLANSNHQILAQQDLRINTQDEGLTLTQFRLTPRYGTELGEYNLLFGAAEGEILLNETGQERSLITPITVSARTIPPITANPINRRLITNPNVKLIGFDWDQTIPGSPKLYFHWETAVGYETEVIDQPIDRLPSFAGPWGISSRRWSSLLKPQETYYVPLGDGIVWRGSATISNQPLSSNQTIVVNQNFLSDRPISRDYIVSTRLIGFEEDGFHWAWWDLDDSVPAMGAIPTLKWIRGSKVRSPHFLTVDKNITAGQEIGGAVSLYDAFTGSPLPILDQRIDSQYGWIPLQATKADES